MKQRERTRERGLIWGERKRERRGRERCCAERNTHIHRERERETKRDELILEWDRKKRLPLVGKHLT